MLSILDDDIEGASFTGHLRQKIGICLTPEERMPSWSLWNIAQVFAFIVNTTEARLGVREVRVPHSERSAPEDTDFKKKRPISVDLHIG